MNQKQKSVLNESVNFNLDLDFNLKLDKLPGDTQIDDIKEQNLSYSRDSESSPNTSIKKRN